MDIHQPWLLKLKGLLFLLLGILSAIAVLTQTPSYTSFFWYVISIWAFCRFYYFAFYVLHTYADPNFKYSGLWSLIVYLIKKK